MKHLGFIPAIVAALVLPASAQLPRAAPEATPVKIGGYLSAEYLKGQAASGYFQGSFENARGGVLLFGDWASRLGGALEFALTQDGRGELVQAWADVRASEAFQVKVGLFLVPFGRYNESRRAFQTLLVFDPYPVSDLFPESWRDIGAVLSGRLGRFQYSAYLGNGLAEGETLASGRPLHDNNKDKGRGGRAGYAFSPNLEVGASYYHGRVDEADSRAETLWGADLVWVSNSGRLTGEYIKAEIQNPSPFSPGRAEGYFAMLTLDFGALTPLVAYETLSYEDPFHGPGFGGPDVPGAGISRDLTRWAFGAVYAPHPNLRLKIEYDVNREGGGEVRNNILRVQAAVHF